MNDLPVFSFSVDDLSGLAIGTHQATLAALTSGTYRLPYDRLAFLLTIAPDSPYTQQPTVPPQMRGKRHDYVIVLEDSAQGIIATSYSHSSVVGAWHRQLCAVRVTTAEWITMFDIAAEAYKPDFVKHVETGVTSRVMVALCVLYQMTTTSSGKAESVTRTSAVDRIVERRERLGIATPQVVRIQFDPSLPDLPVDRTAIGGTGSPRAPHYRRGTWRTYKASGKRIWVNPLKVHADALEGAPPPWYEITMRGRNS